MRVLLTGGAGFVGSHLAERLLVDGHEVVIYDAFTKHYAPDAKRRNVAGALEYPGCRLIEGSVLTEQRLASVLHGGETDVVVHLAAVTGERVSLDDAKASVETNIVGTLNVLERCVEEGVRRFVYVSSSAVYGFRREGPCKETDATDRPLSPYAATKKAGEALCALYHHTHGIECTCVRLFSTYGPRQRPDQAILRYARAMAAGEPVRLAGDGSNVVDLVYVEDAAAALAAAVQRVKGFEVVNAGTGREVSALSLVERLGAALGVVPVVEHEPADPTTSPLRSADGTRAERLLGWKAATDFDEGLRRFAAWFGAADFEDEA
jgi:UDP-glucuronate 4-epimerase